MKILEVTGAYGRRALLIDWQKGLDFKIINGPYFSILDVEKIKADGFEVIAFYDNGFDKIHSFNINNGFEKIHSFNIIL